MELQVGIELGDDIDGADGEGLDIGILTTAERGRALLGVTTASLEGLLSAWGETAARLTLSVALLAGETAEAEASVGRDGAELQVAPVPATLLLGVALVVRVLRALEATEIVPALWVKVSIYCAPSQSMKGSPRRTVADAVAARARIEMDFILYGCRMCFCLCEKIKVAMIPNSEDSRYVLSTVRLWVKSGRRRQV